MRHTVTGFADANLKVSISVAFLREGCSTQVAFMPGVAFLVAVCRLHVAIQLSMRTEGFWTLAQLTFVWLDI